MLLLLLWTGLMVLNLWAAKSLFNLPKRRNTFRRADLAAVLVRTMDHLANLVLIIATIVMVPKQMNMLDMMHMVVMEDSPVPVRLGIEEDLKQMFPVNGTVPVAAI